MKVCARKKELLELCSTSHVFSKECIYACHVPQLSLTYLTFINFYRCVLIKEREKKKTPLIVINLMCWSHTEEGKNGYQKLFRIYSERHEASAAKTAFYETSLQRSAFFGVDTTPSLLVSKSDCRNNLDQK